MQIIRYYLIADIFCRSSVVSVLKYTAVEEDFHSNTQSGILIWKNYAFFRSHTGSKSTYCIKLKNGSSKTYMFSILEIISQSNIFHDSMKI